MLSNPCHSCHSHMTINCLSQRTVPWSLLYLSSSHNIWSLKGDWEIFDKSTNKLTKWRVYRITVTTAWTGVEFLGQLRLPVPTPIRCFESKSQLHIPTVLMFYLYYNSLLKYYARIEVWIHQAFSGSLITLLWKRLLCGLCLHIKTVFPPPH